MVARNRPHAEPPTPRLVGFASALFESWRRLLGLGARTVRTHAGEAARLAEDVVGEVGRGTSDLPADTPRRTSATMIALGLAALAAGIVGTLLLGRANLRNATAAAALMTLWCLARVVLMILALDAKSRIERNVIVRAWAIGLLPYAVAFTPFLHALAWALSGYLAFAILRNGGLARRAVTHALAWGYGSQGLALVAAWIVRNAFVAGAAISG